MRSKNTQEKIFDAFNSSFVDGNLDNEYYHPEVEDKTKFEQMQEWWNNNGSFNLMLYLRICKRKKYQNEK